jgi:hypothetical protein
MSVPIKQMSFSYVIKEGKCLEDERALLLENIENKEITSHNFNNIDLPVTMDPFKEIYRYQIL